MKVGNRVIAAVDLNGFSILYTDDYGQSWSASDIPGQAYSDYGTRLLKVSDNHLLTTTTAGIFKSTDQGATWTLIQQLAKIRTMKIWKGDHLIVGTDNGICEFGNYGEGGLVKKHGAKSSPSNLVVTSNGNILAGNESGLFAFNTTSASWSLLTDTLGNGNSMAKVNGMSQVDDTLFVFLDGKFATSVDEGVTLVSGNSSRFQSRPLTAVNKLGSRVFAGNKTLGNGQPDIYYSDDNGATYTKATFTNNIAYGYLGLGVNFIEKFFSTPNAIIADMNAGYAISTDDGVNWKYTGTAWDLSYMETIGSNIYHYNFDGLSQNDKKLKVSSDAGETWTDVALNGLPSPPAGIDGVYQAIFVLNGKLTTYQGFESPRGIYQFEEGAQTWTIVANTECVLQNFNGISDMIFTDGEIYANWFLNGTYKTGSVASVLNNPSIEEAILYPNPAKDKFQVKWNAVQKKQIEVYSINGLLMSTGIYSSGQSLSIADWPAGMYFVTLDQEKQLKLVKLE